MFRKLLLCLCILTLPFSVILAQSGNKDKDRPAGLFLYCLFDYYTAADQCTVRCYNAYSGAFVIAGYTGPGGGHNNYGPYFNRARFRDPSLDSDGDDIEYGEYALYGFYAKRWMGSYWMYSDWSRPLLYRTRETEAYDDLYLTKLTAPRIEDLIVQQPPKKGQGQ